MAGSGVSVKRVGGGLYDIQFDSAFSGLPGASATQVWNRGQDPISGAATDGVDTRDNAVIVHLLANKMRVKTGNGNGDAEDRYFSFVVIGPR